MRSEQAKTTIVSELGRFWLSIKWLGRVLLLAMLLVVPWHYGSVQWQDQQWIAVFVLGLSAIVLLVAIKQKKRLMSRLTWIPLVFAIFALAQTVPLPGFAYKALSPKAKYQGRVEELADRLEEGLPQANPSEDSVEQLSVDGVAQTISIHPKQTLASMTMLACGVLFLISSAVLFDDDLSVVLMLGLLAFVTLSHGLLGIYERVSWNAFRMLPMPHLNSFSTFVSRNSAPQFYAIGIGAFLGLLVWWANRKGNKKTDKRYQVRYPATNLLARVRRRLEEALVDQDTVSIFFLICMGFLLVAVVGTTSRGGILACLAAICFACTRFLKGNQDRVRIVTLLGVFAVGGFGLLTLLGIDQAAVDSLSSVMPEAKSSENPRYQLWREATSEPAYWLAGTGLGTFHFAILPLQTKLHIWNQHAESIYVEALVEFGLVGFLLLVGFVIHITRDMFRGEAKGAARAVYLAAGFALCMIAVQSLVDFSLILPAIFLPLAALLGLRVAMLEKRETPRGEPDQSRPMSAVALDRVGFVALFLCALLGLRSLTEFAEGERLQGFADQLETRWSIEGNLDSPETSLQVARIQQNNCRLIVQREVVWPEELKGLAEELSSPEHLSAALRADASMPIHQVKDLISDSDVEDSLNQSLEMSARAVAACPFDWRASWGILRGDCGQLSRRERALNYARLLMTTNHHPRLLQRIGEIAMVAGERGVGIEFWAETVKQYPSQISRVVRLKDLGLSLDDMIAIVGEEPRNLARLGLELSMVGHDEGAARVLSAVDMESLIPKERATKIEWELLKSVAEQQGDAELVFEALKQAAKLEPSDTEIRIELAKKYEEAAKLDEALHWARQAARRSGETEKYRAYVEYLEELAAETPKKDAGDHVANTKSEPSQK